MKTNKPKRIRRAVIFCIFLAALFSIGHSSLSENLSTRYYQITSGKLSNRDPIRIVLISDLHDHSFGGDQQPLIAQIMDVAPDVILLAGDMFNPEPNDMGAKQLLEGIHGIAPCFYVTGNHEIAEGRKEALDIVRSYGITVLEGARENLTIQGQTIQIMGIDDPLYHGNTTMSQILQPIRDFDPGHFSILMSHRPEYIEYFSAYGFDLVVSGHTHGGQVRIPFVVNGFYAPSQGWFPKYVGGLYEVDRTTLIISRGLSNDSIIPRIFNPMEVVVIDLSSGE